MIRRKAGCNQRPGDHLSFDYPGPLRNLSESHQRHLGRIDDAEHAVDAQASVADRIETLSRGVFSLQTGTLYPALHRLLRKGWVAADWRITDNARRARYYRLTPAGRRQLDEKRTSWLRATMAVKRILDATAEEA